MNSVIRRNHYDVTDRVFVADPRIVREEFCSLLRRVGRNADLRPVEQAFDAFGRLYAGMLPGYLGCETWYHDAQHSLDCALAMARLLEGHERGVAAAQLQTARARRRRGSPYLRTNVIAERLRHAAPRVLMMAPHA